MPCGTFCTRCHVGHVTVGAISAAVQRQLSSSKLSACPVAGGPSVCRTSTPRRQGALHNLGHRKSALSQLRVTASSVHTAKSHWCSGAPTRSTAVDYRTLNSITCTLFDSGRCHLTIGVGASSAAVEHRLPMSPSNGRCDAAALRASPPSAPCARRVNGGPHCR